MPVPGDPSATDASAAAVRDSLRQLAANLLRVIRGTGRPEDVLRQAQAFTACCAAHRQIAGHDPSAAELAEALRLGPAPDAEADDDGRGDGAGEGASLSDWDRAVREMVLGGLQVAAADLLGQGTQAATGRRELFAGYRGIEKIHSRQLTRLLRRGAT